MAILKPCPRCGVLIPRGWVYCPNCKPLAEAERDAARERRAEYLRKKYNQKYNSKRAQDDPKYRTFRNSKAWRETSRAKLQGCGWECEAKVSPQCRGLACEVHHIEPLRTPRGWDRRLDWSNLMGVCVPCHNVLDNKIYKGKHITEGVIDMRTVLDSKNSGGDPN
jgi:RNA polymerase subunit RPABC4/transcription elongation factor Spt4